MPTGTFIIRQSVQMGGDLVRFDGENVTADVNRHITRVVKCAGAANPTAHTLYNRSTDGSASHIAVFVDPEKKQATAKSVEVEITVGSTLLVFKLDRSGALAFSGVVAGEGAFGGGAAAGTIDLIRVRNIPGTTVTTDDLEVRCTALFA